MGLLLAMGAAAAQPAAAPCTLIYGHGRNHDPERPQQDRLWDRLNAEFHAAVLQQWREAGRAAAPLLLPVAATDLALNLQRLLQESAAQGCTRVLETALFADYDGGALVLRLRLYPLQGSLGPRAAGALPAVGQPLLTVQRELDLANPRSLERLDPRVLGRALASEALAAP
ncbi:hypothetical protein G8A07_02440 [Roseateles sp. DAIF2]|uniref:hypothetical protein n=1 Tax=Roseateles sp. DAIF2 TaxID=2714952 RepID=UPI0018A26793|nr:hypothetical protein [Roseateles sp. DAIF2]QPF71896.1 hypothetical protein G8A07_02440 [Roseateles sp. DAIF2]